jgi:protein SCO1/2
MKLEHGALIVVLLFGATVLGLGFLVTGKHGREVEAEALAHQGAQRSVDAMWSAPDFDFADQRGGRVTKASLAGRPWVVNFIFTTCRSVCPLLTAKMVQLQRKLPDANVQFVSISVDPAHDDPMTLAAYAQRWAPAEKRWSLLATTPDGLTRVLAGFKVMAEASDAGVDPIVHSSVFVLVDGRGAVRGVYDSELRDQFQALVRDAAELASAKPAAAQHRTGPELYAQLSCAACHDNPAFAPALGGLAGRKVELDNALLVDADDGYLLESILLPDAKRVRGYPLRMPSYDGVIDSAELLTLLQYVKAMPEKGAAAAAPKTAEDPVCHMQVTVVDDTPHAEVGGNTAYFCSDSCRTAFLKR